MIRAAFLMILRAYWRREADKRARALLAYNRQPAGGPWRPDMAIALESHAMAAVAAYGRACSNGRAGA